MAQQHQQENNNNNNNDDVGGGENFKPNCVFCSIIANEPDKIVTQVLFHFIKSFESRPT